jgi:hypothetical protein
MGASWGDTKRFTQPKTLTSQTAGSTFLLPAGTDVNGAYTMLLQTQGGTTPVITVSGSIDGVTYYPLAGYDRGAANSPTTKVTTFVNGLYCIPLGGCMFVQIALTSIAGGTQSGSVTFCSESMQV